MVGSGLLGRHFFVYRGSLLTGLVKSKRSGHPFRCKTRTLEKKTVQILISREMFCHLISTYSGVCLRNNNNKKN